MIGNIFVMTLIIYYVIYFTNLFIFGKHKDLREGNIQLDKLRKRTVKTLAEQKAFLDIKYPKTTKKKKTFKEWFYIFLFVVYVICVALIVGYFFKYFKINFNFWIALFIVSVSPFLINYLLSFFKLDNNDLVTIIKK